MHSGNVFSKVHVLGPVDLFLVSWKEFKENSSNESTSKESDWKVETKVIKIQTKVNPVCKKGSNIILKESDKKQHSMLPKVHLRGDICHSPILSTRVLRVLKGDYENILGQKQQL